MSINHDDPRLTAYALGELNSADRAVVEQQIGDSVETLLEIEAIREIAGQLRATLREEALAAPAPSLARSASEGSRVQLRAPSVSANSSLARRASLTPTLTSAAPNRRTSGKFAVAASCLALAGAIGIVAVSGRHEPQNVVDFAKASKLVAWHDSNGNGVMDLSDTTVPLTAMSGVNAEVLREAEVKQYLYFGVNPTRQPPPNVELDSASPTGVRATQPASGSLHGFDMTAIGSGPTARGRNLGRMHLGTNVVRSESEGWEDRDSLPDVGVTDAKWYSRFSDGMLRGGAGLPSDKRLRDLEQLGQEVEFRRLGENEIEERLMELKPSFHRPELLERQSAEDYAKLNDNPFFNPLQQPLSTFSIDVDTAAYSNMRRFLTQGSWPPADSVRIEELVNYFTYDYTPPNQLERQVAGGRNVPEPADWPFAVHMEVAGCPWQPEHRLVRVGLKGREIALDKRPFSNIVFLIDVSGSMQDANKLPLVKAGLKRLVDQFTENDRVGIVVYAGASGLALDSTNATQKDVILSSIENLQAGGSTNGGEGIQLAYALARKHFIEKGTNRVILCTDGDFNVGITNQDDLTRLIEEESKSGVFLSVLGFGMGNLKDSTLEKLADKGNGNYAYIDTLREANKVFVEQMTGTLITIAKDVKIQIEFNPSQVGAYRLIGYENRLMAAQDFHDDTKDAGEIGAGHTVTALYEIIPPSKLPAPTKEPAEEKLKYQPTVKSPAQAEGQGQRDKGTSEAALSRPSVLSPRLSASNELLTIKLRYKQPDADKSQLIEMPLTDESRSFAQASTDFRFAASVASFGMILRHSPHRGNATLDSVAEIAQSSLGADKSGYRSEFVSLVRSAKALQK